MSPHDIPDDLPRMHNRIEPPARVPDPEWDSTVPYSERPPYRSIESPTPARPPDKPWFDGFTVFLLMGNVVGITALVVKAYFCACG